MKKLDVTKMIWIAFTILLFVLYLSSNVALKEARNLNITLNEALLTLKTSSTAQTDQLNESVIKLQDELDALTTEHSTLSQSYEALLIKLPIIDEFELSLIEKMGITDPNQLSEDLMNKPELIPYEGVLGGTMAFTQVYLISDQWAFAKFEDGHIMGSGLYQYKVGSDHSITWELVKANLY
ncbi:hypothetical protein [Fusibacter sp. 3D3]|uniref:hypothetical protein n=1 Tax=Fusibacter sp. 3D3 TaxID=1048380 RepID=UPI000853CDB6|nr:hypothetical protein [Fusibacter sp. 3D3]GAU78502.1 hypothetical protein F3D3_3136 [Fusibacter sp. 3D3]